MNVSRFDAVIFEHLTSFIICRNFRTLEYLNVQFLFVINQYPKMKRRKNEELHPYHQSRWVMSQKC